MHNEHLCLHHTIFAFTPSQGNKLSYHLFAPLTFFQNERWDPGCSVVQATFAFKELPSIGKGECSVVVRESDKYWAERASHPPTQSPS